MGADEPSDEPGEQDTEEDEELFSESRHRLMAGAIGGFIATIVMTIPIWAIDPEFISETIAGMYGMEGVLIAGLVFHLIHGAILGAIFAVVLTDPSLVRITQWRWKTILVGIAYGLMLALIGTGFIAPVWLEAVGVSEAPEMPWVTQELIAWHIIYGFVLGLLFPEIEGRL